MSSHTLFPRLAMLLILTTPVLAQPQTTGGGGGVQAPAPEPVVVTVSARELPLDQVSASVSVITREDIERSEAETIVELLQHSPFVYISQVGGRGGLSTVSIRGGDPNFTLVMLDGIPLNDPNNILGGSFDLTGFSLDNVERIEIVRGPLSARHGSEAIGGVINIISRRGEGRPDLLLGFSGGNFSTWDLGAQSQGQLRAWHYSAGVTHLKVGEQVENEDLERTSLSLSTGVSLGKQSALDFQFRLADREAQGFPPNGGGPEFSILRDPQYSDVQETVFGTTWNQQLGNAWFQQVQFDQYSRTEDLNTPAILDQIPPTQSSQPSIDGNTDLSRTRLRLDQYWLLGSAWQAGLDVSFRHEEGESHSVIADLFPSDFNLGRDIWSWGGELRYARNRYQFDLGLRFDDSDGYALETSPRLGGSLRVGPGQTRLKASWGEGFKLPSFFALGEPNVGNPDLRAERSRGFDVGIEQPFASRTGYVHLTYYSNTFQDLIDFSPEQFRLVNRSHVTTQGIELGASKQVTEGLQLSGHLTYLEFDIRDSNEPLRDRPKWRGGVRLDWKPHPRASLLLDNVWVGPRFDFQIPVPERESVGGYASTALSFTYRVNSDLSLFSRVDNLFDHDFHEFVGFPDPGLYVRFGLRYRLHLQ